jgi:hypothetical protein
LAFFRPTPNHYISNIGAEIIIVLHLGIVSPFISGVIVDTLEVPTTTHPKVDAPPNLISS